MTTVFDCANISTVRIWTIGERHHENVFHSPTDRRGRRHGIRAGRSHGRRLLRFVIRGSRIPDLEGVSRKVMARYLLLCAITRIRSQAREDEAEEQVTA